MILETEFIKTIYQLAETDCHDKFQHHAFERLQSRIEFSSGGWAEIATLNGSIKVLRSYMFKLPSEFVGDFNKVQHLNPFGAHMALGNSRSARGNVDDPSVVADRDFKEHCRKYDVSKALITCSKGENRLFSYGIALFRESSSKPFSKEDSATKERIYPHLIDSFRICRRFDIQRKLLKRWELSRGLATCNQEGILYDADDLFIELLAIDWPQWYGAQLPTELIQGLLKTGFFKTDKTFYRSTQLDDLYLISATRLGLLEALSKREFQIAYKFSNGSTAPEIASELSISPITVKNHLSHVYDKLKVDSKDKLRKLFISSD